MGAVPDHSFDLQKAAEQARLDGHFLRHHGRRLGALDACLQCGACTATCDLAGEDGMFPRRQVSLVRLGLADQAAQSREIWYCYACSECTARCPSGVKPAAVMSALRQSAIERCAWPQPVARAVNDPGWCWAVYTAIAGVLALLVVAAGSLQPGPGPVNYAQMLPTSVLVPVFSVLTVLPLLAVGVAVRRAWAGWYGEPAMSARPPHLVGIWSAFRRTLPELISQRRMGRCNQDRSRRWAHMAIVGGFIGLLVVSGLMALLTVSGSRYPLPMDDPLKVAGNLFALSLIAGAGYYLMVRVARARSGARSGFFEWVFPTNLLMAGLTGVATEVVRAGAARGAAYPVYFVHLVVVLVLVLTLPYSKSAHALYRLGALVGREYIVAGSGQAGATKHPTAPATGAASSPHGAPAAPPSPGQLLEMGCTDLGRYSDEQLNRAYYSLRDKAEGRAGRRYYPNIKRLYLTALEREKDRREARAALSRPEKTTWEKWYEEAPDRPCTWWVKNHLIARQALTTCLNCGMCTAVCPAAEHFADYDPRCIVDAALSGEEQRLVEVLKSDFLWYCVQCGSCNSRCPHSNDIMGTVNSLRMLAQLKGYHLYSALGRQQYFARHLWGGNLWNRACSLYFRNATAAEHPEFGPRYALWEQRSEEEFQRVGGQPDMDGTFAGRKVAPESLEELRNCARAGGTLVVWERIDRHAEADAARLGLDLDQYYDKVRTEG